MSTGADAIVIDVAHGHYYKIAETLRILKKLFRGKVVLIGGNVATGQATADLIKAGADVVKVGVGPGSICTTRVIAGRYCRAAEQPFCLDLFYLAGLAERVHVFMDDAQAPGCRQRDGHLALGDGVHRRRQQGNAELYSFG